MITTNFESVRVTLCFFFFFSKGHNQTCIRETFGLKFVVFDVKWVVVGFVYDGVLRKILIHPEVDFESR